MSERRPTVSICIPAYNRPNYLMRLLDSIAKQTYTDFEVIITDDSDTPVIEFFLGKQNYPFQLHYHKNEEPRGTPENWMEGMKYAKGEWIKIIHDDDWFADAASLASYVAAINEETDCIFSGYYAYYEDTNRKVDYTISQRKFQSILNYPYFLFGDNVIGPPSVVMFRKGIKELYDPELKWLVDLEGYIRMIKSVHCVYINSPLINMSYNDSQVTNDCFRNPEIEVKEAMIYYKKNGDITRRKLMAYDAWWRMLRNLNIRSYEKLVYYAKGEPVPIFLTSMLNFQKRIPGSILKTGFLSKILMTVSYIINK